MALLLIAFVYFIVGFALANTDESPTAGAMLDANRRKVIVNEAFMEKKDVLLDMLESKLKEVRDKQKKRDDVGSKLTSNYGSLVDIKLKANGVIAVGDTEVLLNYDRSGRNFLNINATGISNIGKAQIELGMDKGTVCIPGTENLFIGRCHTVSNETSSVNTTITAGPDELQQDVGDTNLLRDTKQIDGVQLSQNATV